jgi:hypothetical protein
MCCDVVLLVLLLTKLWRQDGPLFVSFRLVEVCVVRGNPVSISTLLYVYIYIYIHIYIYIYVYIYTFLLLLFNVTIYFLNEQAQVNANTDISTVDLFRTKACISSVLCLTQTGRYAGGRGLCNFRSEDTWKLTFSPSVTLGFNPL